METPVLTEFRYRGQTVVRGMFTSESLPVATTSVRYGGGPIYAEEFQAIDYSLPATVSATEHLVVIRVPSLTELEQAVLGLVPEEHSALFDSVPGISGRSAAVPAGAKVPAKVSDRAVAQVVDWVEAEADDDEERRPKAEKESATRDISDPVSDLSEAGSAHTLLEIRMQLRKRR
jgi:hypothetical protein